MECLKECLLQISQKNTQVNQKFASQLLGAMTRGINRNNRQIPALKDILSELQVCCTRQSVNWVAEFVESQGLFLLFQLLTELHTKVEK